MEEVGGMEGVGNCGQDNICNSKLIQIEMYVPQFRLFPGPNTVSLVISIRTRAPTSPFRRTFLTQGHKKGKCHPIPWMRKH